MRARVIVGCCVLLLLALALVGLRLMSRADGVPGRAVSDAGSNLRAPDRETTPSTEPGPAVPGEFVPRRLNRGEKPPQFVLVSFDGAGWDDLWDFWFDVADRVPFGFTAFLSGTYLLSYDTRDAYQPPYHPAGSSQLGWYDDADLPVVIRNVNTALASGAEIGTHVNGHVCVGAGLPFGGDTWTTRDWNHELDQFFTC